jgi:hypothetical protein
MENMIFERTKLYVLEIAKALDRMVSRNMVEKVASIEKKLGIYDLTQFTPRVSI